MNWKLVIFAIVEQYVQFEVFDEDEVADVMRVCLDNDEDDDKVEIFFLLLIVWLNIDV